MALWIMTPSAAHGAAFEEDGGAYAWAVVNGEFLDVEDGSGHRENP
jgi:hypothetical protein